MFSLYEGLKGGELFRVVYPVVFESVRKMDDSTEVHVWDLLLPEDLLMFVSQRMDEVKKVTVPTWLVASNNDDVVVEGGGGVSLVSVKEAIIPEENLQRLLGHSPVNTGSI